MPQPPATLVGKICEKYLPSLAARRAARQTCQVFPGKAHAVQASYGVKNLNHLLILFEICVEPCERHRKPLELQITPWQHFLCLQELLQLEEIPKCYNAMKFRAFCQQESERLLAKICEEKAVAQPSSQIPGPSRSTRTPATRPRVSPYTISSSSSTKILGRKPLPRTPNTFYIFTLDNTPPNTVDIDCIQEADGRSRICWYDKRLRAVLGTHFGIGKNQRLCVRFQMWDPSEETWVTAPKATDTLVLRAGEGRVFKHVTVQYPEALDFYLWAALPNHLRPSDPPLVSERSRSPDRDVTPPPPSSSPCPESSPMSGRSSGLFYLERRSVATTAAMGSSQVTQGKGKEREVIVISDDESDGA